MSDTVTLNLVIRDGALTFGESPDADELIASWINECLPEELLYGEARFTVRVRVEWTTDYPRVPMLVIEPEEAKR